MISGVYVYIYIQTYQIVYIKIVQFLYINYTSIKLFFKEETETLRKPSPQQMLSTLTMKKYIW